MTRDFTVNKSVEIKYDKFLDGIFQSAIEYYKFVRSKTF